ncbi:MAG: ribbon-helix-helix protein, CopG family [Candidatus Thermoplasmatota archaeon]|nr:ribbon-helix-helix protein, CopG family [Candidatus Thermoplasmatota archaeon]
MSIVSTDIPKEMNEELKLLVAAGLYKSKSEALRDAIRDLAYKYRDEIRDVKEARKRLDSKMGSKKLSGILDEIRNEE